MATGQIVKIISNDYFVNKDGSLIVCKARGKFKNDSVSLQVGDYVEFDLEKHYITSVLARKNHLSRPNVANVDQAFLLTSLKSPDFDTNLMDKLLCVCHLNAIEPVICLSKKDLLTSSEWKSLKKIIQYYKKLGYKVLFNKNLSKLKKLLKNKTTVVTGQTGSGKSSLMNSLDPSLNFDTNEISKALGRGKHTTRYVTLVSMYGDKIVDTPGFSNIDLSSYSVDAIKESFKEFKYYQCPYKDCRHLNEDNCTVKKQVAAGKILATRYENYCKIIKGRDSR